MAVEDPPEVVRHSNAASTLKTPPTTVVCKVNRRQKPTPHWSRATQGIRVTDFKPIQREAFLHPVKDSELPGIKAIFQSTRLAKQVATETMEETTYEEIVSSAMAPSMDSSNAFFFQDLEDQGKANKAAFLRFMVRLGNTPVENLPNWDAADGAIINPSFWERMWYEVYKRFGAVGTINATLKTVAASPRRSPAASAGTSDLFPPLHNAPPPGDARTRPLNPYIAKGKKKRRSTDLQRSHTTWVLVKGVPTPSHSTQTGCDTAVKDYFSNLLTMLRLVSPDVIISPSNNHSATNQARASAKALPITPTSGPEEMPGNKWKVTAYCNEIFFAKQGMAQEFVMCLLHDEHPTAFIDKFNSLDGDFHLAKHVHQTWKVSSCCWLQGSNEHCYRPDLEKAIQEQPAFQSLVQANPGLTIRLLWKPVRVSVNERIDWKFRTNALHVLTQAPKRNKVLSVLETIFDRKRKKNFPLNRRYVVCPDGSDEMMAISAEGSKDLVTQRRDQRRFLHNLRSRIMDGAIEEAEAPVYGGGPTLRAIMSGLYHPEKQSLVILSMDRLSPDSMTWVFTFKRQFEAMANELLDRLYMFFKARFGISAKRPFTFEYIEDQEANFRITPQGIVSAGDAMLAARAEDREDWEELDDLDDFPAEEEPERVAATMVLIEDLRLHVPEHFRTHSLMQAKDAASVSTTKSVKCDAVAKPEVFKGLLELEPPDTFDHDRAFGQLRYKSLEDIPGFPGQIPVSQIIVKDPLGAHIEELHRHVALLEESLNLPEPPPDFNDFYFPWREANGSDYVDGQWNRAQQKRMLQAMIHLEHTTSHEFFEKHQYNLMPAILVEHTMVRVCQSYPQSTYFKCTKDQPVVALPVFPPGHPQRVMFYTLLQHNPELPVLQTMRHHDRFHLLGLAAYHILDIQKDRCTIQEFAQTFGLTVTQEMIHRIQNAYIQRCRSTTEAFRTSHHIELQSQQSTGSVTVAPPETQEGNHSIGRHRPNMPRIAWDSGAPQPAAQQTPGEMKQALREMGQSDSEEEELQDDSKLPARQSSPHPSTASPTPFYDQTEDHLMEEPTAPVQEVEVAAMEMSRPVYKFLSNRPRMESEEASAQDPGDGPAVRAYRKEWNKWNQRRQAKGHDKHKDPEMMYRVMINPFLDVVASESIPEAKLEAAARAHFANWEEITYVNHWDIQASRQWGQSDLIPLGTPFDENPIPVVVPPSDDTDPLWLSLSSLFQEDKELNEDVGRYVNSVTDLWWHAFEDGEDDPPQWIESAKAWVAARKVDPTKDDAVIQDLLYRLSSTTEDQAEGP